jgi:hypothetical protein
MKTRFARLPCSRSLHSRELRSRDHRCAPRPWGALRLRLRTSESVALASLAGSGDVHGASRRVLGRRRLPVIETASPFLSPSRVSIAPERHSRLDSCVRHGPPRSPLPPSGEQSSPTSRSLRSRDLRLLAVHSVHRSRRGARCTRASLRSRPTIPGVRALSAPPAPVPGYNESGLDASG